MEYLSVPVSIIEEFKIYSDRPMKWIKLDGKWLDDYDFTRLPLHQRGIVVHLWLLAATRMGNRIPNDPSWLAHKLSAREEDFDISAFVAAGFLAYCAADAAPSEASKEQGPKYCDSARAATPRSSVNDREQA